MQRSRKPIWTLGAILLLLTSAAAAQDAPSKVGVFDAARVSEDAAEARKIQAELQAIRDKKQAEIDVQEQEIARLKQQLNQQALSLSAEKRADLEISIQRKLLDLNTAKDLASRQLQLEIAAAEARFNEKLRAVVNDFGSNENFALILEVGTVAWAAQAIDVTAPIVDQFNRMFPPEQE